MHWDLDLVVFKTDENMREIRKWSAGERDNNFFTVDLVGTEKTLAISSPTLRSLSPFLLLLGQLQIQTFPF